MLLCCHLNISYIYEHMGLSCLNYRRQTHTRGPGFVLDLDSLIMHVHRCLSVTTLFMLCHWHAMYSCVLVVSDKLICTRGFCRQLVLYFFLANAVGASCCKESLNSSACSRLWYLVLLAGFVCWHSDQFTLFTTSLGCFSRMLTSLVLLIILHWDNPSHYHMFQQLAARTNQKDAV